MYPFGEPSFRQERNTTGIRKCYPDPSNAEMTFIIWLLVMANVGLFYWLWG